MQEKRAVMALVAAVILILAAGAACAIALSSPKYVGTGVEAMSEDIKPGDYYEVNISADVSSYYTETESKADFYEWLYTKDGSNDPLHKKDLVVNDVTVTCDCWYKEYYEESVRMVATYYVNPENGMTYGYVKQSETAVIDSKTLITTNIPLNVSYEEQTMNLGKMMKYSTTKTVSSNVCPAVSVNLDYYVEKSVGTYDTSRGGWTVSVTGLSQGSENAATTVAEYLKATPVDKIKTTDGLLLDRYEYLKTINYEEFMDYAYSLGVTVSVSPETQKTIDTSFGQRNVSERTITIFGSVNASYTIDYSEKNVIYSISEQKNGEDGMITAKLVSSNMVYEETAQIYENPVAITMDSFTIALIAVVLSVAAATVLGYVMFKRLLKKDE